MAKTSARLICPTTLQRVDFAGCLLLLLASVSFTAAFQEANSRMSWDSAYFVVLIVVSTILWGALLWWERRLTIANGTREPVLPWRFFTNHARDGTLLGVRLAGGPVVVGHFQLPQLFQIVNDRSTLNAGIQLLPFSAALSLDTITGTMMVGELRWPFLYVIFVGAIFQIIGYAMLATIKSSSHIPPNKYSYEILAGFGGGMTLLAFLATMPSLNERRNHVNGMGRHTATEIPAQAEDDVKGILSDGYNRQIVLLCMYGVAQGVAAMLMWRSEQLRDPGRKKQAL
ncbi:hypothetical protein QQS21_004643 [Conoideocrella luteorostrata]|uniref:Uncharacterized protein n=1 Tax=Conoideocrella luteorostrata TaxID=1105319 RepID=A0AAJ0CRW2_9HYPO|nr:hypothetical protein QQS21_004643 [Conoideocrella luteorostrata]